MLLSNAEPVQIRLQLPREAQLNFSLFAHSEAEPKYASAPKVYDPRRKKRIPGPRV